MKYLLTGLAMAISGHVFAASTVLINNDGPNEGLNDATQVSPVGGNNGTTLGEQRRIALKFALDLVAAKVSSPVPIEVLADSANLGCDAFSGTLGVAGAAIIAFDFEGAEKQGVSYPIALANAMAGEDLLPEGNPEGQESVDIELSFNSAIDNNPNCLSGRDWYYGIDGERPSGSFNFVDVMSHEVLHGLGFQTYTDTRTGDVRTFRQGVFDDFLLDLTTGLRWNQMNDGERAASARNDGNLVWDGPAVNAVAQSFLDEGVRQGRVQMYSPTNHEAGSSVSHWDVDLVPDALMEPFNTGGENVVANGIGLSACVLSDIGWNLSGAGCPDTGDGVLQVNPSSVAFGNVTVGESDSVDIEVANSGASGLVFEGFDVPSAPFSILSQTCSDGSTIAAGDSCMVRVGFAPDAEAAFADTLGVNSDAGNTQVALSGNGREDDVATISVAPGSIDFGVTEVQTTESRTVTVSNTGTANLTVGTVNPPAAPFGVTPSGDNCSGRVLAGGSSCSVTVFFSPSDDGGFSDVLEIPSDDRSVSVSVEGEAVLAASPAGEIDPGEVDFGSVTVGQSEIRTVTVSNDGNAQLSINSLSGLALPFSIMSTNCGSGVAAGGSCSINVRFAPAVQGSSDDVLSVQTNDGVLTANVVGEGVVDGVGQLSATPAGVVFGATSTGASVRESVTVANVGDATLMVGAIVGVNAPFDVPQAQDGCSGESLTAGSSCTFEVSFSPVTEGSFSATLQVQSNANTATVNVAGQGVAEGAPAAALSPAVIDLGVVSVSSEATGTVTLRNDGDATLTIGSISGLSSPFRIASTACGATLPAGGQCQITLAFSPVASGFVQDELVVSSDGGTLSTLVQGTGADQPMGDPVLSPVSLDFGDLPVGMSASDGVTLRNDGDGALAITDIRVTGAAFTLESESCPATLNSGESCSVVVGFSPNAEGNASGELVVDTDAGSQVVAVTGRGTAVLEGPALSVDRTTVSFANTEVGSESQRVLQVSNDGDQRLDDIVVSGASGAFSSNAQDCSGGVAPGASCNVRLTFAPSDAGGDNDSLVISSNGGSVTVALQGVGVNQAVPAIQVRPSPLQFGERGLGMTEDQVVEVINAGTADLILGGQAGLSSPFAVTSNNCGSRRLSPGQRCQIRVSFNPTQPGFVSDVLEILSNDNDDSPFRLTVTGEGIQDLDDDGVDNDIEDGAPNNGDGNDDGVLDSLQDTVASLLDSVGDYITVVSSDGRLGGILSRASVSGVVVPAGVSIQRDILDVTLPAFSGDEGGFGVMFERDIDDSQFFVVVGERLAAASSVEGLVVRRVSGDIFRFDVEDNSAADLDPAAGSVRVQVAPGVASQVGGEDGGGGGGGGCSMSSQDDGPIGAAFPLMLMLGMAGLMRRRRATAE
ncbi:MAG: choice-of-anchor D domain-containing protein [Salinisphaeraceae bacterium]